MPRIGDVCLGCVLCVYPSVPAAKNGEGIGGTAFLVSVRMSKDSMHAQLYAVTNKHVIRGMNSRVIALRMNSKGAGAEILETSQASWFCDPDDDLAVFPLDLSKNNCTGTVIPDRNFLSQSEIYAFEIGPGDETFTVGRFIGHDGKQKNFPIVRFGNIAMMPEEPIRTREGQQLAFLVEPRSLSGFSGSPVFTWLPIERRLIDPDHPPPGYFRNVGPWLLGVNCGRLTIPEFSRNILTGRKVRSEAHSAIEVVIPSWKLKSLFETDELVEKRKIAEKEVLEKRQTGFLIHDTW